MMAEPAMDKAQAVRGFRLAIAVTGRSLQLQSLLTEGEPEILFGQLGVEPANCIERLTFAELVTGRLEQLQCPVGKAQPFPVAPLHVEYPGKTQMGVRLAILITEGLVPIQGATKVSDPVVVPAQSALSAPHWR